MNVILVLLKTDGERGSAVVACTSIRQDPLFPTKVVLENVQGVSWPFHDQVLSVQQWSVDKGVVINWMVGSLEPAPSTEDDSEEQVPEINLGDPHAFRAQEPAGPTLIQPLRVPGR